MQAAAAGYKTSVLNASVRCCSRSGSAPTAVLKPARFALRGRRSNISSSSGTPTAIAATSFRRMSATTTTNNKSSVAAAATPAAATAADPQQQQQQQAQQDADFARFEAYVLALQDRILTEAEALDGSGAKFLRDRYERSGGAGAGYGITAVLEGGALLEKAAANISIIHGKLSPQRAQAMSSRGRAAIDPAGGQPYSAAAMSLVFHSAHPRVPTLRADVRLFQVAGCAWFGGGCDLTPSYLYEDDAVEFHRHWRAVCDKYGPRVYPEFKAWCDKYFYIPCRGEHRGIGGIFFDDVASAEAGYDAEAFVRDVGDNILPSWTAIAARRRGEPFTDAQRQWQLLRRGRYLEFNLLYDRGVRFGLDGGRVESIMVSAPPLIAWKYNVVPEPGSPEAALVDVLRAPREWA